MELRFWVKFHMCNGIFQIFGFVWLPGALPARCMPDKRGSTVIRITRHWKYLPSMWEHICSKVYWLCSFYIQSACICWKVLLGSLLFPIRATLNRFNLSLYRFLGASTFKSIKRSRKARLRNSIFYFILKSSFIDKHSVFVGLWIV